MSAWAPGKRQLKPAAARMGSCVQGRGAQGGRRLGPKSYSSGASEVTGRCRLTHELTSDGATAADHSKHEPRDQPKCHESGCTGSRRQAQGLPTQGRTGDAHCRTRQLRLQARDKPWKERGLPWASGNRFLS